MIRKLFSYDNPLIRKLSVAVDVFFLNILFIATSLPLVNIMGNMISLSQSIRLVRAHTGEPYAVYFRGLLRNFTMGVKAMVIFLPLLIVAALSFMWSFQVSGVFALYSRFCSLIGMTMWSVVIVTFVDYASRYQDVFKRSLYNAFRIGLTNVRSIMAGILLLFLILQTINPTGMLTLVYLASFGGIAVVAWLDDYLLTSVYDKYLNKDA
ncbi:hypothetical protein [Lacticaseibacillus jixiensis]|uniref:hypothetical protein n=1 Tax=Lacticaseibacillus jixiensis TaxID=3231926 RepID=UPI0036F1B370